MFTSDDFDAGFGYFDSVLSGYEYISLLEETVKETVASVEKRIEAETGRSKEYFQVVRYNLAQCEKHLAAGKKLLNNLRRLEKIG